MTSPAEVIVTDYSCTVDHTWPYAKIVPLYPVKTLKQTNQMKCLVHCMCTVHVSISVSWVKLSLRMSQVTYQVTAYPGFCSMKQQEVLPPPPPPQESGNRVVM